MREDKLKAILTELNGSSVDIEASAIISTDGLVMGAILTGTMDEDLVGAMTAAMLALGERTAHELERGELEQVWIKGRKGYVLITHAGPDMVVSVVAKPTAKLGLIFLDIKRAVKSVTEAFGE